MRRRAFLARLCAPGGHLSRNVGPTWDVGPTDRDYQGIDTVGDSPPASSIPLTEITGMAS